MMLYPSLPQLLNQVNSRYMLVNVIAHRARSISQDAEDQGTPLNEKPVSIAIGEIASDELKIQYDNSKF